MSFTKKLGISLAALTIAGGMSSANAQERWSMATPWGGGPLLEQAAKGAASEIKLLTGGAIEVEVFPGGTLGKALKVTDTVSKGVAQMGHNWPGYDWGIDRTGVLFGGFAGTMPHEQMVHWLHKGGGADMWMEWRMDKFNVAAFGVEQLVEEQKEMGTEAWKRIKTKQQFVEHV